MPETQRTGNISAWFLFGGGVVIAPLLVIQLHARDAAATLLPVTFVTPLAPNKRMRAMVVVQPVDTAGVVILLLFAHLQKRECGLCP